MCVGGGGGGKVGTIVQGGGTAPAFAWTPAGELLQPSCFAKDNGTPTFTTRGKRGRDREKRGRVRERRGGE